MFLQERGGLSQVCHLVGHFKADYSHVTYFTYALCSLSCIVIVRFYTIENERV